MPSWVLFVVRVVAGLIFWQHGLEKLVGFAGATPEPTLWSIRGVGGILEGVGGPLLILGLFTRPVAFVLSGEMAVAYFRSWAWRGFFPIANGGEEATLNAFLFLWLVFAGPGSWSVDAFRRAAAGGAFVERLRALEPHARALLRVIVGFLLTLHGVRDLFGVLPPLAGRRNAALALDALPSAVWPLELVGGVLLMCGLVVRPASTVLAVQALCAYVFIAAPRGFWTIRNGGGEALLYFSALLIFAVAGSAAWSLAARQFRTSRTPASTKQAVL